MHWFKQIIPAYQRFLITWRRLGPYFFGCCLLCFSTLLWAKCHLVAVRLSTNPQLTRIVFVLTKKVDFNWFGLRQPRRLVMDLSGCRLQTQLSHMQFAHTAIKQVRYSRNKQKNLRIVFDLTKPVSPHVFWLAPTQSKQVRLVMDLPKTAQAAAKLVQKQDDQSKKKSNPYVKFSKELQASIKAYIPKQKQKVKRIQQKITKTAHTIENKFPRPVIFQPGNKTSRKVIVVIDPGHGGKDPGATGPRGIHEKNVVLAISRDIARYVNRMRGMRAVLTRHGDYYLTLRQRLRIARRDKADIFVAVHADAFKDRKARGASVFALSQRGASSEAARWLAEKENYSELGGINLNNKSNVLRSVLIDLSQTATIGASLHLGGDVLRDLRRVTDLHSTRVEQARFVVLKSPDIPSILIETGFISNLQQERQLNNRSYQQKLAHAICRGIKSYFWQRPPLGTWIAQQKRATRYVVRRGDTLSVIAQRYGISSQQLRKFNRLTTNKLLVGQVLHIPKQA